MNSVLMKDKNRKFNDETLQTMKNIEEEKNLSRKFKSVKDLMEDLKADDNEEMKLYKEILKREAIHQKIYSEEEVIKKFGIDKVNPDDSQVKIE